MWVSEKWIVDMRGLGRGGKETEGLVEIMCERELLSYWLMDLWLVSGVCSSRNMMREGVRREKLRDGWGGRGGDGCYDKVYPMTYVLCLMPLSLNDRYDIMDYSITDHNYVPCLALPYLTFNYTFFFDE